MHPASVLALAIVLSASPARAATVGAFALPEGYTVKPESELRLISIAPDHTIAAVSELAGSYYRAKAFRWRPDGSRSTFAPLFVATAPGHGANGNAAAAAGVAAGPGAVYVTAAESWSGAYSGTSYEAQRWTGSTARRWHPGDCGPADETDQHANAVDARGRVALTYDMTGNGSFMVMQDETGRYAPFAFVIDGARCRSLGRAVVMGLRGRWAAGYRGYLNGHLAATNINTIIQRYVAVRWHDTALTELGDGAAYAVSSAGLAVGASAVPGRFESMTTNFFGNPGRRYDSSVPHALAWDARGKRIALERGATRSIAYDVGDDGTAVGMLQAPGGKHFAFRWRAGRLERLDDLPHPAGWRFESAYSIAPDGTIAGIGTLHGIATVFTWRDTAS